MISWLRIVGLCSVIVALSAVCASAQQDEQAEEQGRFRLGPLRFTPSIAVSNVGVDDNVFNSELDPKSDTTGAFGPAVDLWLRAGRSRLTGKLQGQYLYFKTYKNQRSWNTNDELRWEFPLGRITPFVAGTYANTKSRPGYEIDSRAHLRNGTGTLGASIALSTITTLVLSWNEETLKFDEDETFFGANLASALNRRTAGQQAQLRFKLTSLTTFVLAGEALQDRFVFDRTRDSNSIKVLPGFELRPAALISGKVFVGFRQFDALNEAVPDYRGAIAVVNAMYTAGPTRFALTVNRDLTYSYEPTQPYYTLTDLRLTITERLGRGWDVIGLGGRQLLDYHELETAPTVVGRTDTIRQYGGGIGYRIGRTLRVGFDAVYYSRHSSHVGFFDFDGLRFGGSISYGLPQ